MAFVLSEEDARILDATGHLLVTGGPGCGKTTVALHKARTRIDQGLLPGQGVLFLSFSKAAVSRILQSAGAELSSGARRQLDVQTFHSFCLQLVRGHGYLLGAPQPIQLLPPQDEKTLRERSQDDDAWRLETERLFLEEGRLVFDLFAPKALALLVGSDALRGLITNRYPLVIVDEAQDTGTDQWAVVAQLTDTTQIVCLADLDQQIYDFRPDVSGDRLKDIMAAIHPVEVDLGSRNNRSTNSEILQFGNDILNQTPRGSPYVGVQQVEFNPTVRRRDAAIRGAIQVAKDAVLSATGREPESIGYLTTWGKGVGVIARALQGDATEPHIPHNVAMDDVMVLLATRVVAGCLEPVEDVWNTLAAELELIADLYRAKDNANKVEVLLRGVSNARQERIQGAAKCPPGLKSVIEQLQRDGFTGHPGRDWLRVRKMFEDSGVEELKLVAAQVVYLMAFNRGRRIAEVLASTWQQHGGYADARLLVEEAVSSDQIGGGEENLTGIHVMTMHKSKGKEFDAVVLLHLGHNSPFAPDSDTSSNLVQSRRLLRVAITRARHSVVLLTDVQMPSPLLWGHHL